MTNDFPLALWDFLKFAVPIGVAIYLYIRQRQLQEKTRLLQLSLGAPEILYEWRSNYLELKLAPTGDPRKAARQLNGSMWIRNQSAQPIHDLRAMLFVGTDVEVMQHPYRRGAKCVRAAESIAVEFAAGAKVEVAVVQSIRNLGIDLTALFSADPEVWQPIDDDPRFGTPYSGSDMFEFVENRDRSVPGWNPDSVSPYAVNCRLCVSYTATGRTYQHVLTGSIGFYLPIGDGGPIGGGLGGYFDKQGISRIAASPTSGDEVVLPQVVFNQEPNTGTHLGPGRHLIGVRAETGHGGRCTQGFVIQILPAPAEPAAKQGYETQSSQPP